MPKIGFTNKSTISPLAIASMSVIIKQGPLGYGPRALSKKSLESLDCETRFSFSTTMGSVGYEAVCLSALGRYRLYIFTYFKYHSLWHIITLLITIKNVLAKFNQIYFYCFGLIVDTYNKYCSVIEISMCLDGHTYKELYRI